jgi:mannose-6-phosphate isomerase-like protein (cupin superfamily)
MNPTRKVDFGAYERRGYEAQYLYNGESCRVIASNVPPHAAAPPHHVHPVDQLYYVVEGEMNVVLGSEHFVAGPETLVHIPAGTPHHNWNEDDVDEFHFEVLAPTPAPAQEVMVPSDSDDAEGRPYMVKPLSEDDYEPALPGFSIQRMLRRADSSEHMSLYVGQVDAGGAGPGTHVHEFDQFYYVLDGTMSVEVGLHGYTATRHTLVVLPAGVPHRQWNDGPGPERHLTLIAPEPGPGQEPWDVGVEVRLTGANHS